MIDNQALAIRLARVLNYNKHRIERALALFPEQTRPLFHAIPLLLHINHPDFPGYVEPGEVDVPFGLLHFTYRQEVQDALKTLFPDNAELIANPKSYWPTRSFIESLSLMGSIGTMAQSGKSDLDYWVCVDPRKVNDSNWDILQQKLTIIENWCWDVHHLEVHFFLSDITKVRNNDFGEADGESAGSAQPTFLKNEYYSTHIVLAGKFPYWWLAPANCTDAGYRKLVSYILKTKQPDPKMFMDLGNVERLEANEIFGAAIWQLTKAMDSPFKSVLKMAKLEVFMDHSDKRMPLCNVLKGRVHKGVSLTKDVRATDPYTLMFDTVMKFYEKTNPKWQELFKACLYIKSDCPLTDKKLAKVQTFKRKLVFDYVKSWGWDLEKVVNYDNVKHWSYQEVAQLGKQIHSFLIGCYRRLSTKLKGCDQLVSAEDMTVIGRKIESFYSLKEGKIQYLKRAFEEGLMQPEITITMELDLNFSTKQRWSAFRGRQHYQETKNPKNPCFLKDSSDPVDLVLWCIFNRIINDESEFFLLQSNLTASNEDLQELIGDALQDYQPIRVSEQCREQLLAPCQITHCLLVVNFSSHASVPEVETVRTIYLTSWGEVYSFGDIQAFEAIKSRFSLQEEPPKCLLFTPARNKRKILYREIEESTDFQFEKVM